MNRRACLAALGAVGVSASSGCLGANADRRPGLQVDRSTAGGDSGCVERELLENERVVLAPRLAGPLGFPTAVQWELDLHEGEELSLRITSSDVHHLPNLGVEGPAGAAIIDERPVENIYTIHPRLDGRHAITVTNRRLDEGGEWFVDLNWYSATGCRR